MIYKREGKEEFVVVLLCAQFSSVQSLSRVWLFATPWTAARQVSLFITNSQSSPTPMTIESVMPSNHLIFCCPLFLLPSIFPSISVFSNESALCIRWPKYWSFSFNISPYNEHPGLISFRMDWLDLLAVQGTPKSSVLAWRIPGTGEPGGLPSIGSHRVSHDWSDLAAAAAGQIMGRWGMVEMSLGRWT